MVSPPAKRCGVRELMDVRDYSERHACGVVSIARSSARYVPHPRGDEQALRDRIRELANEHKEYGCPRIIALLRREGSIVNKKRAHRIWKEEGLQLTHRRPKKRRHGPKGEVIHRAEYPNHVWTYDFVEDRTERGRKIRMLTIVDENTRECLAILVARSIPGEKVINTLEWLFLTREAPAYIRSDNGPEFIAKTVRGWLKARCCQTIYIEPGSPWENPFIESFNGKLREECLNRYEFVSILEAQEIVEAWRIEYNTYRPHSSLNYLTPVEFANQCAVAGEHSSHSLVTVDQGLYPLTVGGT